MKIVAVNLSVVSSYAPIAWWRVLPLLAVLLCGTQTASGNAGDFTVVNFAAAAPFTYDPGTGGGAFNDGSIGDYDDIVHQLQGSQFQCGQVATYLVRIAMKPTTTELVQTARLELRFAATTTGQPGVALSGIAGVNINYGSVENGDDGSGLNPGRGSYGLDSGIQDDGGSSATLVSATLTGPVFASGSELVAVIDVDDLEAGESVVVRVDVRLECQANSRPTGNLQAVLVSATALPSSTTISSGAQTIPFNGVQDITGAGQPLLGIVKNVTTEDGDCAFAGDDLDVTAWDSVKYCYTVSNGGTATLYNVAVIDDNGTSGNTADDFTVTLAGLQDLDSDGQTDDLASGGTATGTAVVTMTAVGTIINTATAAGDNGATGNNYEALTASDTATVRVATRPNNAPVANDDSASTPEDTAITVDVLANDTDADGDVLTVTGASAAAHGTTAVNADGTITYTPAANFHGSDSFTYTISDGYGGTDTATVTVTVDSVNDLPVAVDDAASTNEDTPVTIDVLANDTDADGDTLTVASVTQGTHGTVVNNGSNVSYTPNANFHGSDSFTYTVSDGNGGTDTATVTITIGSVNDPPDAVDDTASTNEDTPVTVSVLTNDIDADGDTLTITSVTQGTHGSVINNGSDVSYTPSANFHGSDSFTYTISDGHGGTDTATVSVTISSVNDSPDAVDDTSSTNEDTPVTVNVLTNDTDADGDTLTVASVTQGSHGAVANNGSNVVYTPNANFHGSDSFTYTISDGHGGTDTATVTVTVSSVNDSPDAVDDTASTNEDTPAPINVLTNDTDVDGDTLTVASVTQGSHGTVVNNGSNVVYTPNANFHGSDSFTYTISDGHGGTDTATVNVTVNSANDPPDAVNDTASTNEDTPVPINVLANDTDADGDTLTVASVTQGTHGTVANNGSNVSYTPNANFHGSDSFTYTISDGHGGTDTATVAVTVSSVNDPPVAVDDTTSTNEDTAVTVNVLANDSDVDGDSLTITSVTQGAHGAVINNGSNVRYTPSANFYGSDGFTYTISDGHGGTDTATVNVTVNSVNDPPVAVDDTASTNEDTAATVSVLANDTDADGDTLTITSVTQGSHGAVVNNGSNVRYTPGANFHGSDSFTYTISDGHGGTDTATVSVTVNSVNDPPVAVDDTASTNEDTAATVSVLANDTDVDGDTLTITSVTQGSHGAVVNNGSNVRYTPGANFHGSDSFTYTISDGHGGTDTATVTVTVAPVNDPPVAVDDTASTNEDTPVTVSVLANDTDVDGDALAIASVTQGTHGTVVNNGSNVSYAPNANFHGSDSFTYAVSDGHGGTDTATVSVTVSSINDSPVAVDDAVSTNEDTPITIDVLANDMDVDGDTLTITSVTQGIHGTVVNNGSNVGYTPTANFHGPDSFTYTISDGHGGTDTATVTVMVVSANDPPVAVDDAASTQEDASVTVEVLMNDTDVDGDTLTVVGTSSTTNGTVVVNPDGTITYTPGDGFSGPDSFTYTVSDGHGGTGTATVTITVASVLDWIDVITQAADRITPTSAMLHGLLADEGEGPCEASFQYWILGSTDVLKTVPLSNIRTGKLWETLVTGLKPGTTYRYFAFARNSWGFARGVPVDFTTPVRLAVSSTKGGTVVAPGLGEFLYPKPGDVAVTATVTDPNYYFWCWQGTAAAKVQDINQPNTTVFVDGNDTLIAAFLKNTNDLPDDRGPASCRCTEFSTSQYWVLGDPSYQPDAALQHVYDITGVSPGGRPPLPGTSLAEDSLPVVSERWWPTDVLWHSDRTGLLLPDGLRPSVRVWVSGYLRTKVTVQMTWHPVEGIDSEVFTKDMPYEPVFENVEPTPLAPPHVEQESTLDNGWRHVTYVWELSPGAEIVTFAIRGRIVVDTLIVDTCTIMPAWSDIIHVDDNARFDPGPNDITISDPLEIGTPQHPFDSIQEGIDFARDGDLVLVHDGRYTETIDLSGKAITVATQWLVDPNILGPSIIDSLGMGPVVRMASGEGNNCLLSGFTILGNREPNRPTVSCNGSGALISHCAICGNMSLGDLGATVVCMDSEMKFINCTLTGNRTGPNGAVFWFVDSPSVRVLNTIIWGNDGPAMAVLSGSAPRVDYSDIQGGWPGSGVFDLLPQFADPGRWEDRGVRNDPTDDLWIPGDYHVRSSHGRLDTRIAAWLLDEVDSPDIDAGHPESVWLRELQNHGYRSNIGLYGGTPQASKSRPKFLVQVGLLYLATDIFPGSKYDNAHSQEADRMGAKGTFEVWQESGAKDVTIDVHVRGLSPDTTYRVYFDKDGVTPQVVGTAGPSVYMGLLRTDDIGMATWTYTSAPGDWARGVYTWSIYINKIAWNGDKLIVNNTVLISDNLEFEIQE